MIRKRLINLNLSLHEGATEVGGIETPSAIDSQTTDPVIVYGKPSEDTVNPSPTPANPVEDRSTKWNTIKGEYKDLYEADFKGNLDRRLKGKNTEIGTMRSVVDPMMKFFGLSDMNALKAFIDTDIIPQIDGYTPTAYNPDADPGDGVANPATEAVLNVADLANESLVLSEKLKEQGVQFDLQTEIDNPAVNALLKKGLTLEQSYVLAHHDEIMLRETQKVATAQKAATIEAIRTKGLNAVTEVASKPAPKVIHKSDPSKFSNSDLDEIARRVARGEEISF